jgi:hypothetical protein
VHAPSAERSDGSKESFFEELEQVFDHFPKYHMTVLLVDVDAKEGKVTFSIRQLGMRVYIRIVTIMVIE